MILDLCVKQKRRMKMNTNFFVAEDEVFNPNKVLTRK